MPGPILVIGNKNYSSWSLRPWIFMKQMGIPFEERRIPLFTESTHHDLLDYDSNFKVPVLKDGNLIIWDSLSILEYLSEQYLDGAGWPAEKEARALARTVSAEMHSSFTHIRNDLPMNCRKFFPGFAISEEVRQEVDRAQSLWQKCRQTYGEGGGWLFGEYSIADAMYAPLALRFHGYDVSLGDDANEYVQAVLNQPCIEEWIEAGKLETEIIAEDEV